MKTLLLLLLFPLLFHLHSGDRSSITVNITNIKTVKGNMVISLYNKAEDFPTEGKEFRKTTIPLTSHQIIYTFKEIPAGDYAIATFHDENSDGKCNQNFLGIPKEGYSFSNNVKPVFSAPSFNDAKIRISVNQNVKVHLYLIN